MNIVPLWQDEIQSLELEHLEWKKLNWISVMVTTEGCGGKGAWQLWMANKGWRIEKEKKRKLDGEREWKLETTNQARKAFLIFTTMDLFICLFATGNTYAIPCWQPY